MITKFHQFLKKYQTSFRPFNALTPSPEDTRNGNSNSNGNESPTPTASTGTSTGADMSRVKARRGKRSPSKVDSAISKTKSILSYFSPPTRKSLSPPPVTKTPSKRAPMTTTTTSTVKKSTSSQTKECLTSASTPTKVMSPPSTPDSTPLLGFKGLTKMSSPMSNQTCPSPPRRRTRNHVIPDKGANFGTTSVRVPSPASPPVTSTKTKTKTTRISTSPSVSLIVSEHSNESTDTSKGGGVGVVGGGGMMRSPSTPIRKRKTDKNQMSLMQCIERASSFSPGSSSTRNGRSPSKLAQSPQSQSRVSKSRTLDTSPPPKARRTKSNSSPRSSGQNRDTIEIDVNTNTGSSTTPGTDSILPGGKPSVAASSKIKNTNTKPKTSPKTSCETRVKLGSFNQEPCLGLIRVPSHECSLRDLCQFLHVHDPFASQTTTTTQQPRRSTRRNTPVEVKPAIYPLFKGAILGRMERSKTTSPNKVPIDIPLSAVGVSRTQAQIQSIAASSSSKSPHVTSQQQQQHRIKITPSSTNPTLCRYLHQQQTLFPSVTITCMTKASNAFRVIKSRVKQERLRNDNRNTNENSGHDLSIMQSVVQQGKSMLLRVGDVIEFDAYNRPCGPPGRNSKHERVSGKKNSEHVFRVVAYYPTDGKTPKEGHGLSALDPEDILDCAVKQECGSLSIADTSMASPLLNTTQEIRLLNISSTSDDDCLEIMEGDHLKRSQSKSSEVELSLDSLKIVCKLSSSPDSSIHSAEIVHLTSFDESPPPFNQKKKIETKRSNPSFDGAKVACKLNLTPNSNTKPSESRTVGHRRACRARGGDETIRQTNPMIINEENVGFSSRPQIGDRFRALFKCCDLFGRRGRQREMWSFGTAVEVEEMTNNQYKLELKFDNLTHETFDYPSKRIQILRTKKSSHGSLLYEAIISSGRASFAYDSNPSSLHMGDLVQCRYQNGLSRGRFYQGRVAAIHDDKNTFDVAYFDGEYECGIPLEEGNVHLIERGSYFTAKEWLKDVTVEDISNSGDNVKGRIVQIEWDESRCEEMTSPIADIRGEIIISLRLSNRKLKTKSYDDVMLSLFAAHRDVSASKIKSWPSLNSNHKRTKIEETALNATNSKNNMVQGNKLESSLVDAIATKIEEENSSQVDQVDEFRAISDSEKLQDSGDSVFMSQDQILSKAYNISDIPQSLGTTLWRALNSSEPHNGFSMLMLATSLFNVVPNSSLFESLSEFTVNGPKCEGTRFLDPHRTELVNSYSNQVMRKIEHSDSNVEMTFNEGSWIWLERILSLPIDMNYNHDELSSMSTIQTEAQTLQFCSRSLKFCSKLFRKELSTAIRRQDSKDNRRELYAAKVLTSGVLEHGIRSSLKCVVRLAIQCHLHHARKSHNSLKREPKSPDEQLCELEFKSCTSSLGQIVCYSAWLYCAEESLQWGDQDCCHVVRDVIDFETGTFNWQEKKGGTRFSAVVRKRLIKDIQLQFLLSTDTAFSNPFQRCLGNMLGLEKELSIIVGSESDKTS